MLTSSEQTRNDAFYEHQATGALGKQQERVLFMFQDELDHSIREVAYNLDMDTSSASGRINELKRKGLLVEAEQRKCRISGKTITPLKACPVQRELLEVPDEKAACGSRLAVFRDYIRSMCD